MTPLSFNAYLRRQHKRDDAVGDLARDMRKDATWPTRARSLGALKQYLRSRAASALAILTLEQAHREWTASTRARPVA